MRILHTSDWHLGKSLNQVSLIEDQRYMVNKILDIIKKDNIEVLLICGDIFDKANPTVEALKLFEDILYQISKLDIKTVIIGGNHDNYARLGYGSNFLSNFNIYLYTNLEDILTPLSFDGEVGFYCLPYFSTYKMRSFLSGEKISNADEGYQAIIARQIANNDYPIKIALLHNYVINGEKSDSESIFSLGGIDSLSPKVFKDFNIVAAGHLHKSQKMGKNIFYSGSILKYSVSEHNQNKMVYIYDTKSMSGRKEMLIPQYDVVVLQDTLDSLLTDEKYDQYINDYVYCELTNKEFLHEPISKLRSKFKNCIGLKRLYLALNPNRDNTIGKVDDLQDIELFKNFYQYVTNNEMNEALINKLGELFDEMGGQQ
ncbi:MAG: exonuclease SbcCD subunit D [Erysipelotrichaceae bacterium]